LQNKQEEQKK